MSREKNDTISDIHDYNLDFQNRIIYLHEREDYSENQSPEVNFRMSQNFVKNINILQNVSQEPITIYMQTIGGDWHSGMGIFDAIKSCTCKVTLIGYGQICSMGTIIMQAAHRRILMPSCIFMCHYGVSELSGDYLSAHNYAMIDRHNMQTMVDIYAEKCHKTGQYFKQRGDSLSKVKSYIKRKMKDGDWYLTAEGAIDYGFADYIFSKSIKL